MREIIRFTTNRPVEVAFRRGGGKRVSGDYGPQMMYTLTDERVMYVPLIVADRIQELGIGHGEPFEICKAEVRDGNRRSIEWRVSRAEQPPQPDASPNAPAAVSVVSKVEDPPNGNRNGHPNGAPRFEVAWDGTLLPVPVTGTAVTVMETALNAALDIAQRVERRAGVNRRGLQFTSDDIRAIGLTMFIQAMRDGGVRWES